MLAAGLIALLVLETPKQLRRVRSGSVTCLLLLSYLTFFLIDIDIRITFQVEDEACPG